MLTRLMAQPLMSRFPMEGSISGHHRSPHRGSSVEFAEYRNYVPGDDIRRLDWRVFGRTDRFYMKEFEAETNLRCYLVTDFSGSMRFSSQFGSKIDYARRLGFNAVKAHREWTRAKPPATERAARKAWRAARPRWEADHIVPVADGGGECGLENYRLLCRGCHVKVTLAWRAQRAAAASTTRSAARLDDDDHEPALSAGL